MVWGDPFHVANLVAMWGLNAAFGEMRRGEHEQRHHRQVIQSMYGVVHHNRSIASLVEKEIANEFLWSTIPHVSVVRERQQRWMVNQRHCCKILGWFAVDCGGDSFFYYFLQDLASGVRAMSAWQANAAEHAAMLVAMPAIRTAMQFEAEMGIYFNAVMSWHSRAGLMLDQPGSRMLEVHAFFFRFELPFWKKALESTETVFPKTISSIQDTEDDNIRDYLTQNLGYLSRRRRWR